MDLFLQTRRMYVTGNNISLYKTRSTVITEYHIKDSKMCKQTKTHLLCSLIIIIIIIIITRWKVL